jgi:hypothetical protein
MRLLSLAIKGNVSGGKQTIPGFARLSFDFPGM